MLAGIEVSNNTIVGVTHTAAEIAWCSIALAIRLNALLQSAQDSYHGHDQSNSYIFSGVGHSGIGVGVLVSSLARVLVLGGSFGVWVLGLYTGGGGDTDEGESNNATKCSELNKCVS